MSPQRSRRRSARQFGGGPSTSEMRAISRRTSAGSWLKSFRASPSNKEDGFTVKRWIGETPALRSLDFAGGGLACRRPRRRGRQDRERRGRETRDPANAGFLREDLEFQRHLQTGVRLQVLQSYADVCREGVLPQTGNDALGLRKAIPQELRPDR